MLKVFRDNLKNLAWILWVIIALFVLALAADFGASNRGRGNMTSVAQVGGESVSQQEFQRAYKNMTNFYRQIYGDQLTPEIEKQMYRQALSQTVVQKILLAEARRQGLRVTDAELRDRILSIPNFKDEQGRFIGEEIYTQTLAANQISVADFETELRDEVLMKKLNDALAANLYVSEDEIQQAYRNQVERAKIRYVQLPRASFAVQVAAAPQSEVEAFFQAHKAEFKLPEQRDLAYLLVSDAQLASQVNPGEPDLRAYYDAHKAEYTQEDQVQARHVLVMVNDQRNDAQAQARGAGGEEEARRRGRLRRRGQGVLRRHRLEG